MTETGNRGQSRLMSLVEAIANVLGGYGLAVLTQILVFPLFGLRTTLSENLAMGLVFTIVSLARSYALRRTFEAIRRLAPVFRAGVLMSIGDVAGDLGRRVQPVDALAIGGLVGDDVQAALLLQAGQSPVAGVAEPAEFAGHIVDRRSALQYSTSPSRRSLY
jgi:hypothetical protein